MAAAAAACPALEAHLALATRSVIGRPLRPAGRRKRRRGGRGGRWDSDSDDDGDDERTMGEVGVGC
jgi:hypothetical protein